MTQPKTRTKTQKTCCASVDEESHLRTVRPWRQLLFFSGSTSSQNFPYTTAPYRPMPVYQLVHIRPGCCCCQAATPHLAPPEISRGRTRLPMKALFYSIGAWPGMARSVSSGAGCRRTSDTGLIESLFAVVVAATRHSILLAYPPNYLTLFSPVWRPKRLLSSSLGRFRFRDVLLFSFITIGFWYCAFFHRNGPLVLDGRRLGRDKPES